MADLQSRIQAKINGKKVVMYSKPGCPFCTMAKEVLKKYNLSADDYEIIEINRDPEMGAIQDEMKRLTGGRTVPRVFINGKCIGGGSETQALDRSGELTKMLK